MSPGGAGSESLHYKSSLLLSFKKEESFFLKKRRRPPGGKQKTFILCANLIGRFRSEACFQVVRLIGRVNNYDNSFFERDGLRARTGASLSHRETILRVCPFNVIVVPARSGAEPG